MSVELWLVVAYVGVHALLCVHGLHRAWLQLQLLRTDPVPVPPAPETWPLVCVQLPVFNERNVVVRSSNAFLKVANFCSFTSPCFLVSSSVSLICAHHKETLASCVARGAREPTRNPRRPFAPASPTRR